MILLIEIEDADDYTHKSGDWNMIEGDSAAEKGSLVQIRHIARNQTISAQRNGRLVGYGTVRGFKYSNKANQPLERFAKHARESDRR